MLQGYNNYLVVLRSFLYIFILIILIFQQLVF